MKPTRTPSPEGHDLAPGNPLHRNLSETHLRNLGLEPLSAYRGALPSEIGTTHIQVSRCLNRIRALHDDLSRYEYLSNLKASNSRLFYRLLQDNLVEICPYIYTPTVGLACQQWSEIYQSRVDALYLSANDRGKIREILEGYEEADNIDISVVTDGSRILGLGDLGLGGVGISIGKLSLYIAAAGISPDRTLPCVLDLGTNNKTLLEDPLYLGLRQPRLGPKETREFVAEFVEAYHQQFPNAILQFEDFSNDTCFDILAENRDRYPVFNDDIQGTAAVALAGFIRALELNKTNITQSKIVFFGAGSAAVGIAEMMRDYAVQKHDLSVEAAAKLFWLVDSKGLVADNRGDKLAPHKLSLSRKEENAPTLKSLEEVIDHVQPTALLGLSTVGGSFTASILKKMASFNPNPIIFPLSNPTSKSECTFEDALINTQGRVRFASGSPFPPVNFEGVQRRAQQGNNMYIFPAVGKAAILARVQTIPDALLHASAQALADSLNEQEVQDEQLYPELTRIREISMQVTRKIIRVAQKAGVDRQPELRSMSDAELDDHILKASWNPLPDRSHL